MKRCILVMNIVRKVIPIFIVISLVITSGCTNNSKAGSNNIPGRESVKIGDYRGKDSVAPEKAAEALASSYANEKNKFKNAGLPTNKSISKFGKSVPILEYHCVDDNIFGWDELFVSPAEFEKQMSYLKNNDYTVITFNQLSNIKNIKNPVIITFDDGYEDNYTNAYPILKKFNFSATIFLISGAVDSPHFLKRTEISEMKGLISFESHTKSHPHLTKLKDNEIANELTISKKIIEGMINSKVDVLAYPYGDYNRHVMGIAKKYYKYGVYSLGGLYHAGDNPYCIKRVYITRKTNLDSFIKMLNGIQA